MNEELNKKLNEWAGTMDVVYTHPDYGVAYCFKWLVPKLHRVEIIQEFNSEAYARITIQPECEYVDYEEWAETPALALCLAIEKLIEERE